MARSSLPGSPPCCDSGPGADEYGWLRSSVASSRASPNGEQIDLMRSTFRILGIGLLAFEGSAAPGLPAERAQLAMPGAGGRSLGGYGASAISSYYGGGSTSYVPFSGNSHGFVPYRGGSGGGGGGGLGAPPISRRLPETSIGGAMMAET